MLADIFSSMNSEALKNGTSLDGLQYLRGIASLMVVFFHSRSYFVDVPTWTDIGARGVDLFFVTSGFIMAYTTKHLGGNTALVAKASLVFLSKRFIRVVPLYWLALLWTSRTYWLNWWATATSPKDLVTNLSPELISVAKDAAFIPHLSIDEDEEGEIFPILIQGWTLNYEMFFYLIFACCMFFRRYRLLAVSVIMATLVVVGKMYAFTNVGGLVYTSSILIEFVFGILVFKVYSKTQHLTFDRSTLIGLGVIGFLLLNSGSNVNDKFVLGVAAAVIVWVFIHAFRDVQIRPLKILGDASYSIYLFHAASFVAARELIGYLDIGREGYLNVVAIITIQIFVAMVASFAIYYFIEKPMLKILRKLLNRVVSRKGQEKGHLPL